MTYQFHFWEFIPKNLKTLIQNNICTPMFTEALFTIVKIWKQSKCPSVEEWIKKLWYNILYNGILFVHKKERKKMLPFVTA